MLQSGVNGTAVVLLSVAYVHQAAIFPDDNQLLRRIAYVETTDGTHPNAFNEGNNGGIWAVSDEAFASTQVVNNSLLALKRAQIMQIFSINWDLVQWSEMDKPLYSVLAARLVLFVVEHNIPSDTNVMAQAQFWMENYNSDGSVDNFVKATGGLEGILKIN